MDDENKEFLNEEHYQKVNKKVNVIGTIMMILGLVSFITCSILIFGHFLSFRATSIIGFLWVMSFAVFGIGLGLFTSAHRRQFFAYAAQQQIPIVKEGMEKMAPSVGKAGATIAKEMGPAYHDIAKEVSSGIKEGLKGETIYCRHCGSQIEADSKFCKNCGKEV